jgi:hypothetical protein
MSIQGIKPIASLGSALLGRRAPARRVPLSFAPPEEVLADSHIAGEVPEVVLQVARLAQALGLDAPTDGPAGGIFEDGAGPVRRRVAFTLRLDPVRHARLRQIAAAQRRSAQTVLVEAFDRYCAGSSGSAASSTEISATAPSPRKASTGNQP